MIEKNYVKVQIFEFIILVATIAGLFLWCRSDSKEDHRNTMLILDGIRQEIKDFHGRLCTIEERNRINSNNNWPSSLRLKENKN